MPLIHADRPVSGSKGPCTGALVPLENNLEQQVVYEGLRLELKQIQLHHAKARSGDERLVWMVRAAAYAGESRLGQELYSRLISGLAETLDGMAKDLVSPEPIRHVSSLSARVHLLLAFKTVSPSDDDHANHMAELDGLLHPLKGLYARDIFIKKSRGLHDPLLVQRNASQCLRLWSRWVRYGPSGGIEVREYEREQLWGIVCRALDQLRAVTSSSCDLFKEYVVDRLVQSAVGTGDGELQYRLLRQISDAFPKLLISQHLDDLVLAVCKFTADVRVCLSVLYETACASGGVKTEAVWFRLEKVIRDREELDVDDKMALAATAVTMALKEDSAGVLVAILRFIDTDIVTGGEPLQSQSSASQALVSIMAACVVSLGSVGGAVDDILRSTTRLLGHVDGQCSRGLGRKLVTALAGAGASMQYVVEFIVKCEGPEEAASLFLILDESRYVEILGLLRSGAKYAFLRQLLDCKAVSARLGEYAKALDSTDPLAFEYFLGLAAFAGTNAERYDLFSNVPRYPAP